MNTLKTWAAAAAMVALTSAAQAALVSRGGGMVYDDVQNITWLADWNLARTQYAASGGAEGDADGLMNWNVATAWVASLVQGGYSDWRLPTAADSDTCGPGYGCAGNELGHIFYQDLGGEVDESVLDPTGDSATEIANLALFTNVQAGLYWTSALFDDDRAWLFYTNAGFLGYSPKTREIYAVAVRDGDVAAAVPEPQTLALALLALGATAVARRRRSR